VPNHPASTILLTRTLDTSAARFKLKVATPYPRLKFKFKFKLKFNLKWANFNLNSDRPAAGRCSRRRP
jgi:hypothetical protein